MGTRPVEIPDEILRFLEGSKLGDRPEAQRVRMALAIFLFQEGSISIGKAAQLAGEPRVDFEWHLSQMGFPIGYYGPAEYEQDSLTIAQLKERKQQP